jgi:hypothetical protein
MAGKKGGATMASNITLEQVEALATQLPPAERLKLAARITEQLSVNLLQAAAQQADVEERLRQEQLRLADQLLAQCEGIEDDSQGSTDAVALLRRQREERIEAICRRDA